ncbi:hypothetical protein [Caminicella sporogenes]|uniref:hypothetical protein n=1 Tax=Caminicella sporogenes TaxID=166485 RepID=UPI0025405C8D|nr:hypothetical protein [Caminicella sporogenes]WIF94468.1 hypothetical protein QNI18_09380 [Caminicella sporogenes]
MKRVYLKMQERDTWDDEFTKSIIGYYKIIIPRRNRQTGIITEDYQIIRKVREVLYSDIESIKSDEDEVEVSCYKGCGDFVETLEDLYKLKKEIEERVEKKMEEAKIFDYTLIIELNTLY